MTIDLAAIERIPAIEAKLDQALQSVGTARAWWTLQDAAQLKGVSWSTLRAKPEYQPRGGRPDAVMHGRRVWRHSTIMAWLEIHDGNREQYLGGQHDD